MIKTKAAFLDGGLFSSQSMLFENFSNCSDWLDHSLYNIVIVKTVVG